MKHSNKAMMAAMQQLRRSNAAAPHVPKPKKGTRAEKKRRAIAEWTRSLGDSPLVGV